MYIVALSKRAWVKKKRVFYNVQEGKDYMRPRHRQISIAIYRRGVRSRSRNRTGYSACREQ